MAYNQFSHPVAPPDLYSPIGDDILLRGAMQTYENAAKAGQNLSAYNSKLFGINTYGKDAEVLADYENQFNQNVAELSQHGISSPEAMSRMNTLISSYTNNPDILAIHRRANAYNNELQLQKEYEAKSLTYVSPIVDEGQEYFSGDTYIRDKRFSKTGWVSPNQAEDLKKAKSLVEKKIGFKENPDGTRESYEYYDPNDLKSAYLTVISSNPNYEKDALYRFEKQNRDVNWEDYSKQEHATLVQEAAIAMNLAKSLYNSAKDASSKQKALEQYTKAQQIYTMYSDAFDNPSSAEEAKYNAFNDFKNRNLQQVISAMDAEQRKPLAMNEIRKAQLDLSNDLYKMKQSELFKAQAELFAGLTKEEQEKVIKQGNFEGVNLERAAKTIQTNKLKTAQAANPNYKITSSDVALNYKDEDWKNKVFVTDTKGKLKIPNNDNAKQMVVELIKSSPNDFPEIPTDMLNSLSFNDIEVTANGIEIDNSILPFGATPKILAQKLLQVKNKLYDPNQSKSYSITYDKNILTTEGFNESDIQEAVSALVNAGADTTTANIRQVLKDNGK